MHGTELKLVALLYVIIACLLLYPIRSQLTLANLSAGLITFLAVASVSAIVVGLLEAYVRVRRWWRERR